MAYTPAKHKDKPIKPRYHYVLATVPSSKLAAGLELLLRDLAQTRGVSLFSICHSDGECDVMGDSGEAPLTPAGLRDLAADVLRCRKQRGKLARTSQSASA